MNVRLELPATLEPTGLGDNTIEAAPAIEDTVSLAGMLYPETVSPAMTPVAAPMVIVCVAVLATNGEVVVIEDGWVNTNTSLALMPTPVRGTFKVMEFPLTWVTKSRSGMTFAVEGSVTMSPYWIPLKELMVKTLRPAAAAALAVATVAKETVWDSMWPTGFPVVCAL